MNKTNHSSKSKAATGSRRIPSSLRSTAGLVFVFTFAFVFVTLSLISLASAMAWQATEQTVPTSRRAVESLVVNGELFVGILWSQSDESISIVVEREWLKRQHADRFNLFVDQEAKRLAPILESYENRFNRWIEEVNGRPNQEGFVKDLEVERDRIAEENASDPLQRKRFMLLSFDRKTVDKIKKQPEGKKRVAALAWEHNLDNVSNRSADDLTKALREKNVDVKNSLFDLSAEMPAAELTDRQWSIRKGIYEFEFTGELEFQGEGDQLFRVAENVDMNQVLAKMMGNAQMNSLDKLGRELGLPEFTQQAEKDWSKEVTSIADAEGRRCVLVKRITDTLDSDLVTVEATLLVKLDNQRWEKVATTMGNSRLSTQTDRQLDDVRNDPRVKSTLDAVARLGLGGNPSLLEQAIRKGSATSVATKQASDKIELIIGQNTRHLESPWTLD